MYVVLRMDDITVGYESERSESAINWAVDNQMNFSFGIIAGGDAWPTTCAENSGDQFCDDVAVKAVYDAYAKGSVVGTTGGTPTIELFDHSWDHGTWGDKFRDLSRAEFKAWMDDDMNKSITQLRSAFPEANIQTKVCPENLANEDVLTAMQAHDLSILSTQGTMGCDQGPGSPPQYNYYYGPCEHDDQLDCTPPDDIYVTSEGWQTVNGIFSTPSGAGSSTFVSDTDGITPEQTWGEGTCGCVDDICSVVSNAEENARKSNGLRWSVLMMHPQNEFKGFKNWNEWLDKFVEVARASPNYEVHFVTFQDLVKVKAANMEGEIAV